MDTKKDINKIKNNFRAYDQEQPYWDTIYIKKLLESEHPARIIDTVVEKLNLEKLYKEYRHEGNPPYHPKMMLKILFYAYYIGIMSCRKMWNAVMYRSDFIYLAAGQVPNFRTINSFRKRHIRQLPDLFAQVVMLCVNLDLVGFKYLSVDGETIKANANFQKNKSKAQVKKELERLKTTMEKLLKQDIPEDEPEEIKEWREKRERRIKEKYKKLEGLKETLDTLVEEEESKRENRILGAEEERPRRRESDSDKVKFNLTDPQAPILQHKDSRILPSYQHQSAADGKYGVVCAVQTTRRPDHPSDLIPIVDKAKENTRRDFDFVLADCAFGSLGVYERIEKEKRNEEYYVPDERYKIRGRKKENKGKYPQESFTFDEYGGLYCPAKKPMKWQGRYKQFSSKKDIYYGTGCGDCKVKKECTDAEKRIVGIDIRTKHRIKMWNRLDSQWGRYHYSKRGPIIENVHGDDQKNRNWIQHHLRGYQKAEGEFCLIRIGTNLRKIVKYGKEMLFNTNYN